MISLLVLYALFLHLLITLMVYTVCYIFFRVPGLDTYNDFPKYLQIITFIISALWFITLPPLFIYLAVILIKRYLTS